MKAISFVFALILCISLGKYIIVSDEPVGCIVRGLRKVENVKYKIHVDLDLPKFYRCRFGQSLFLRVTSHFLNFTVV